MHLLAYVVSDALRPLIADTSSSCLFYVWICMHTCIHPCAGGACVHACVQVEHVDGFMLTAFSQPANAIAWGLRMQELMLRQDW